MLDIVCIGLKELACMHACILLEEYKYMYVGMFALHTPMVADILIFCSEQMHTPLCTGRFFL